MNPFRQINKSRTEQDSSSPSTSNDSNSPATMPSQPAPSSPKPTSGTSSWSRPQESRPTEPVPGSSPAASPRTSQSTATSNRNVLSDDVEIIGKVKFTNDLLVDGKIDGEITSDGTLTVGENARLKAEISVKSIVVYGKIEGNITVTDRVELRSTAELVGDIKAATLVIEAGAVFVGKSAVGAAAQVQNTSAANQSTPKKAEAAKTQAPQGQGQNTKPSSSPKPSHSTQETLKGVE